jgi:hypothetical protein
MPALRGRISGDDDGGAAWRRLVPGSVAVKGRFQSWLEAAECVDIGSAPARLAIPTAAVIWSRGSR